jgi:hypothetical protein
VIAGRPVARPPTASGHHGVVSLSRSAVAAVLLYVQAALAALGGSALIVFGTSRRRRVARRLLHTSLLHHPTAAGLVLLVVAAALAVIGVGVAGRRPPAQVCAYVAEGVMGMSALVNFHPLHSVVGIGLAATVVVLVASDHAGAQPGPLRPPAAGPG